MYSIEDKEFKTLEEAMVYAKTLNRFITIKCPNYEIVGMFGAAGVTDIKNYDGWISRRKK
jgi:hypothetical protein